MGKVIALYPHREVIYPGDAVACLVCREPADPYADNPTAVIIWRSHLSYQEVVHDACMPNLKKKNPRGSWTYIRDKSYSGPYLRNLKEKDADERSR